MDLQEPKQLWTLVVCAVAFLLGSVPFGLLVARIYKVGNLRQKGSGNIGATNVSRVLGFWPAGAMTLVFDLLKGVLPVLMVQPMGVERWSDWVGAQGLEFSEGRIWLVGLCAVLGHCFSPWLRFKGGKGVATGLGVLLSVSPWSALAGVIAFTVAFLTKRIGSISSIAGLIVASVTHLILNPATYQLLPAVLLVSVVLLRHKANIDALLEDRENTF